MYNKNFILIIFSIIPVFFQPESQKHLQDLRSRDRKPKIKQPLTSIFQKYVHKSCPYGKFLLMLHPLDKFSHTQDCACTGLSIFKTYGLVVAN